MKKIHLSIPKPCHENWEAMTPTEKGKFCGSCQKTVVDFTKMSDRQIAAFFKKPPTSVCGRAYDDQLNRAIIIPKKRIPWVRYFFQLTWPAFVLFLKSCGFKESTKGFGKVVLKAETPLKQEEAGIVGVMLPEITPVDTTTHVVGRGLAMKGEIMGDTVINEDPATQGLDTTQPATDSVAAEEIAYKPMDTVVVSAYSNATTGKIMLGGISVCKIETREMTEDPSIKAVTSADDLTVKVYPNPVRAGSALTVSIERSSDPPERMELLSTSGQLIAQVNQNQKQSGGFIDIHIPSNVATGIYWLQMIWKNNQVRTTKVIVRN